MCVEYHLSAPVAHGKGKLLRISSSLNTESEEPGKISERDYALHSGSREVLLPNFHATA